jgi:hypothetical protein
MISVWFSPGNEQVYHGEEYGKKIRGGERETKGGRKEDGMRSLSHLLFVFGHD